MDEKELKKLTDGLNSQFKALEDSIKGKADAEAITTLKDDLTGQLEKISQIKTGKDGEEKSIGEYVQAMQEQLNGIDGRIKEIQMEGKGKLKTIPEQLKASLLSDEYKKFAKTVGQNGNVGDFNLELKAANIDTADVHSGTIQDMVEPGVSAAPWRPTPIWDALTKGVIGQGVDSVSWWEETTRTDSAAMATEETAPSTGSAKTWTKQNMTIMKIMDFTKVSSEALEDFEYINSDVQDLMMNGIPRKRETELLAGAGTTIYLKGLTQYAKTYAKPSNMNYVASPNKFDVLMSAILQVANGYTTDTNKKGFISNFILLNPGDIIDMRLTKDGNGVYLLPPFVAGELNLSGARIVPSLDQTAGTFLVCDMSRAKVYLKRNLRLSFHYENGTDVLEDLVLVLVSQRLAGIKITAADAYAFVTGTFNNGIEALTAV